MGLVFVYGDIFPPLHVQWLEGCWFYRPEETFHVATRKFYEKVRI